MRVGEAIEEVVSTQGHDLGDAQRSVLARQTDPLQTSRLAVGVAHYVPVIPLLAQEDELPRIAQRRPESCQSPHDPTLLVVEDFDRWRRRLGALLQRRDDPFLAAHELRVRPALGFRQGSEGARFEIDETIAPYGQASLEIEPGADVLILLEERPDQRTVQPDLVQAQRAFLELGDHDRIGFAAYRDVVLRRGRRRNCWRLGW